ncbi:MAG: KpsF/GutQ family sugar-phosphate isomerase [Deltaproteobacteria bacterium]|nr:KpsF/GutQ family sugar-phosphate isomerase [Deltaproteobacteria bacterium]
MTIRHKNKDDAALTAAFRVLEIEADAVRDLAKRLDGNFTRAVDMMISTTGKVVVSGMGKSGIICQKIASTLASTGTSAFFMHPAEGVHGDLGVLMKNDILIAVSNSGETDELIKIIPVVKRLGLPMVAMTGSMKSTLAKEADCVLDVGVKREACPLGLAPTASTTACLAMGDALAVALLDRKGFKARDFAELHPAGSLGRRFKRVEELMHTGERVPRVAAGTLLKDAVIEMSGKRLGITGVFKGSRLVGAITDGDLRRALSAGVDLTGKTVDEVMTRNPKAVAKHELAEAALRIMEEHTITVLFVCDSGTRNVAGVVHMHDIVKAGVI